MTTLAHDARAPVEVVPEVGMILCRLGRTATKPGAVFGPTAVELFRVVSVSAERPVVTVTSMDRPGITEHHALAGGLLRLAAAPNKVSFTYVAPSMREMRARFT